MKDERGRVVIVGLSSLSLQEEHLRLLTRTTSIIIHPFLGECEISTNCVCSRSVLFSKQDWCECGLMGQRGESGIGLMAMNE